MNCPRNEARSYCPYSQFVQYEFKYTAIIMLIVMTLLIICFVLIPAGYPLIGWTVGVVALMCQLTPSLLSTLWMIRKISMISEWKEVSSSPTVEKRRKSTSSFNETLEEILNDEQKFEAFIDWMYKEFCSEAILSFLEMVQFRKYTKEEINKTDESDAVAGDPDPNDFTLYHGMPRSSIVYDSFQTNPKVNSSPTASTRPLHEQAASLSVDLESVASPKGEPLVDCKRIAHLLFKKYIEHHHAEREINISSQLRKKYVKLEQTEYDGMDLKQFMTVYDDVIAEMIKYQHQSYARFERANED